MKVKRYKIYCETEAAWRHWYLPESVAAPTTCPTDTGHTVTGGSVSVVATIGPDSVEIANKPDVKIRKPDGSRAYIFGVDFCDRKTWYVEAVAVTDEAVGTSDGVTTVFNLDHGTNNDPDEAIIDTTRGLITDDHLLVPSGGGTFVPVVKVDGVEKTMREPYESSGGDYALDFDTGVITFFSAPANAAAITASYYYAPNTVGPEFRAGPPVGKQWTIDKAEAQITADFTSNDWFTDTIMMNVFYAPYNIADPANEVRYYNYGNLLDYSSGSYVDYPACAGARGYANPTRIFRWDYATPIVLTPDYELRAWTKHGRPLGAERATVVMYALEEDYTG